MKKFSNLLLEFFKLPSKDNTELPQGTTKVFTSHGMEDGRQVISASYHVPVRDRDGKQKNLWVSVVHHPEGAGGDVKFPHSEIHFDVSHVTPAMFWEARVKHKPGEQMHDAYYKAFTDNHPDRSKRTLAKTYNDYDDYLMNTSNQFVGFQRKKIGSLSTPTWIKPMVDILWHHVQTNPKEGRTFVAAAGGIDYEAQREKHAIYGKLLKVMETNKFIKTHDKRYSKSKYHFPLMHHFSVL